VLFIGITGGVGAGKSAVLKILAERVDSRVLLADEVAHLLMRKGDQCYESLLRLFPEEDILGEDGEFDRIKLASLIFSDEKKRKQLNEVVHPAVKQYVIRQVESERERGEIDFFFFEAALLLEDHYDAICDELWYIYTNEKIRRQRLKDSRGYSDEKITNILASQKSEAEFLSACSEVIDNNGTSQELQLRIDQILRRKIHE